MINRFDNISDNISIIQNIIYFICKYHTKYYTILVITSVLYNINRYLAGVTYKLRLNSWSTKYSQNVTRICKNILSVKHILHECPIATPTARAREQCDAEG